MASAIASTPRLFAQVLEKADVANIVGRRFRDTNFVNCRFERTTNAVLERCSTVNCRYEPKSLLDMLGTTITLDCLMLEGMEFNEMAMDALLYLLTLTKGNEVKRRMLLELINPRNREQFEEDFQRLSRK